MASFTHHRSCNVWREALRRRRIAHVLVTYEVRKYVMMQMQAQMFKIQSWPSSGRLIEKWKMLATAILLHLHGVLVVSLRTLHGLVDEKTGRCLESMKMSVERMREWGRSILQRTRECSGMTARLCTCLIQRCLVIVAQGQHRDDEDTSSPSTTGSSTFPMMRGTTLLKYRRHIHYGTYTTPPIQSPQRAVLCIVTHH